MSLIKEMEALTQLAHSQPSEAARTIALALQSALKNNDEAELISVTEVVEALAEPLVPEFEPLLFYSRAIAKWSRGDVTGAIAEFRALRHFGRRFKPRCYSVALSKKQGCLKITDVVLDMPPEVFERVAEIFEPVISSGGHFSTLRTNITDAEILKTSLQELGFAVKTDGEVRGYMGQRVRADIVAVLKGAFDLGWNLNADGVFDLICDLGGVSELYNQTDLINSIMRQYANNQKVDEAGI